jgi:HlyD family secretion protein
MPKKRVPKVFGILAVILIIGAAVFLAWWFLIRQPPVPKNIITLSGRIEGDDSVVAAKTSGRIRDIRVREGDVVKAGLDAQGRVH